MAFYIHGVYAIACLAVILVVPALLRTYRARRWISRQRSAGLPMPKHSRLFGHLPLVKNAMRALPQDCAADTAMANIAKDFPNGVFYFDFAPFDKVNIIVTSADVATQVQKLAHLGKPEYVNDVVDTICGGRNLFTMSGQLGKSWRNTFNRGFSVAYMQTIAPLLAREVQIFRDIIGKHANSGKVVPLLDPVTKLAIDIIASIGLDARVGYQQKDGVLSSTMMSQLRWGGFSASMSPTKRLNPLRPLMLWYNKRQIHKYIGAEIDRRYVELGLRKENGNLHAKSAISLALQEHASSMRSSGKPFDKVEPVYKASLVSQIMLFLMAGQDTTSSTTTFCLHQIYADNSIRDRLRAEHNEVFGTDLSSAHIVKVIDESADKLNELPYTLAVIKETLRLYPPASTLRKGEPGVNLTDSEGNIFPTEGCNIWVVHAALHRDPRYFAQPNVFLPDRWLVAPDHPLYPVKGAWRPFETGQRSCLGQTLAILTIKITLLMTVRSLEITAAYNDVEPKNNSRNDQKEELGDDFAEKNFGDAYPVYGIGLAVLPNKGYPCRIRKSEN